MMQYMEIERPDADSLNAAAKKGWRLVCCFRPDSLRHPAIVHAVMERERPTRTRKKKE